MQGRRAQRGFTFIELLSVVMIIGIITTIALPNIKNYTARAKVSEAVTQLTRCRTTVSEIYQSGGNLPDDDSWGCEENNTSKFVSEVHVSGNADPKGAGIIKVTMSPGVGDLRIANAYITLAPMNRSGTVMNEDDSGNSVFRWRCGNRDDGTDMDQTFLPGTCRGIY